MYNISVLSKIMERVCMMGYKLFVHLAGSVSCGANAVEPIAPSCSSMVGVIGGGRIGHTPAAKRGGRG